MKFPLPIKKKKKRKGKLDIYFTFCGGHTFVQSSGCTKVYPPQKETIATVIQPPVFILKINESRNKTI